MARKRIGNARLNKGKKSEVITIRIDPRLKYLAELAARRQRRPLSGFIEWTIETCLRAVNLEDHPSDSSLDVSVLEAEKKHCLWDVDESDRVAKLAFHYPELMTFNEQLVWKLVQTNGHLWRGQYRKHPDWQREKPQESDLDWEKLRKHWDTFKKVAAGELTLDELPDWFRENSRTEELLDDQKPF